MSSILIRETTLKVFTMDLCSQIPDHYDAVHNPKHYAMQSISLEPKDVMTYLPSHLANAFKYICRAGYKDDEIQDLEKALEYIRYFEKNQKDQLIHPDALRMLKLYADHASCTFLWDAKFQKAKTVKKFFKVASKNIQKYIHWHIQSDREDQLVNEICRLKKKRLAYPDLKRDPELLKYLVDQR